MLILWFSSSLPGGCGSTADLHFVRVNYILPFRQSNDHFILLISESRRSMSSSNPPPPSERASEIINKLPSSPNLITKTGTALLGTGLAAAAISQELYVVNEETVLLVGSAIFLGLLAKVRTL